MPIGGIINLILMIGIPVLVILLVLRYVKKLHNELIAAIKSLKEDNENG